MVMQWARGFPTGLTQWVQGLYDVRPAMAAPMLGPSRTAQSMDLYRVLRAYYYSNGLYDVLRDVLRRQGIAAEALKPLRNPTYRVVEFHAGHLWPGSLPAALPIMADNADIIEPIQQVWSWSNWGSTKQVGARHLALYGDMFIKVVQTDDGSRVYFQVITPEQVTDFDSDERDFLTYARIDVPMLRRNADGTTTSYMHVETWDKQTGLYQMWEHVDQPLTPTEELGTPTRQVPITSFGIDFIPIVHAKFADIGENRGLAAIVPALDKIDEANRQSTRLAQMLFRHNNVTNALERSGLNPMDGRPLPPVRLSDTDPTTNTEIDGTITLGDDTFLTLPGNTTLKQLVPNLNYDAALHVLQDHMIELEGDLPELVIYRMSDGRDLSGRAVRLMLGPAIKRVEEARGNAESALVRADQMALTIGQNSGLWDVGSFENGDFEHCFEQRDVLATDELERAQAQLADGGALKAYVEAGMPLEVAVQEVWGWSEERAAQFTIARLAAIQREQTLATEDVVEPAVAQ
jgi:hypothetical protein